MEDAYALCIAKSITDMIKMKIEEQVEALGASMENMRDAVKHM